jgi:hypothetical protein
MMGMSAGDVVGVGDNLDRWAAMTFADARELFFDGA